MENTSMARAGLFLRLALGVTMLSAVADRLGLWGAAGSKGVAWGNWNNFIDYTQQLNTFASRPFANILGVLATIFEIGLPVLLIVGYRVKLAALATGTLMLLFATAMAMSLYTKAPLDYSVITSAAAAFLLSTINRTSFALDNKLK